MFSHCTVVIWSDMLGGVLIGEEPLPWSGPLFPHQISGERRETGQASQCCLLPGNVGRLRLEGECVGWDIETQLEHGVFLNRACVHTVRTERRMESVTAMSVCVTQTVSSNRTCIYD